MKRLFSALLAAALLLSLTACGGKNTDKSTENPTGSQSQGDASVEKNPEDPTGADTVPAVVPLRIMKGNGYCENWEGEASQLVTAGWEELKLIDDYPELADALFELNNDQSVGGYSFVHEWLPAAQEHLAQSPEYFGGYTFESRYTVQRADSLILSIREDHSAYTGGVHPNYGAVGMTYDTATGVRLELTDVLTDTDSLDEILTEKIREKYSFDSFDGLHELLMDYAPEDYDWTLSYQGITFYFDPYEIAPFAAGLLTATIWFDEMPELFRGEYMVLPQGGYAMALPYYDDVEVDLYLGDDVRDSLSFWTREDEYGEKYLTLELNGQQYTDETCWGYIIEPYLVCMGEQDSRRCYIYAEATIENDYRVLYSYDLSSGTPRLITDYSGVGFHGVWDPEAGSQGMYYTVLFNDPAEVALGTKCHMLGTKTAYRNYALDMGGTLQPLSDAYELDEDLAPIISSIPLDVKILPQNTVETVPAGTEFFFLRTDNESWVDLAMTDGRECRIELETLEWPHTINGIPEEECFANLLYAG